MCSRWASTCSGLVNRRNAEIAWFHTPDDVEPPPAPNPETHVGSTASWGVLKDVQVDSNGTIQNIAAATPIATFDGSSYSQVHPHTAFFLSAGTEGGGNGFFVLDQYNTASPLFPDGHSPLDPLCYEHAEIRFISVQSDAYMEHYYTLLA